MSGSIWKGAISFGLINIPVLLQKAEESKRLQFTLLDEHNLAPIKYKKVNSVNGKEVSWDRINKGYEYEKNKFVLITKDELKQANPKATQTIDIEDFVKLSEIDVLFIEKPYYLVPQKSGIKGYFLLSEALNKTKKVAIAKIIIRTKQHLSAIISKGNYLVLEILRFADEVIEENEVQYYKEIKKPKLSIKELKMAEDLINGMTSIWNPSRYKDTYKEDIKKLIKTKIKKGHFDIVKQKKIPDIDLENDKIIDLMPLLKKSLELKKAERKA